MRIALCQINPVVGDLAGNAEKILAWSRRPVDENAELAVFPELWVSGSPPQAAAAESMMIRPMSSARTF